MSGLEYREISEADLPALLELYRYLHATDSPAEPEAISRMWRAICVDPNVLALGGYLEGRLVTTCTLVMVPNLTRGARPYGLIENVVTRPEDRGRGLGTGVLRHALGVAWERGAYKVMLLTGRADREILRFYEGAGFVVGVKTGFVAYPETGQRQPGE